MTSPNVPRNAYTDSPEKHPNLILGSLQLLFWIFFRPSALLNHAERIDRDLNSNSARRRHLQWESPKLWRFMLPSYLVLPLLISLLLGLVLCIWGQFIENTIFRVALGFAFGLALFISVQLGNNKTLYVAFNVLGSYGITIALVATFGWKVIMFGVGVPLALTLMNCILFMVWGGFVYLTGGDKGPEQGKKIIINSVIAFSLLFYTAIISLLLYAQIMYPVTPRTEVAVHYMKVLFGAGVVLALMCLIYGCFLYITDQGKEENAKQARQLIINSIIAIFLLFCVPIISLVLYRIMYALTPIITEVAVHYMAEMAGFSVAFILNLWLPVVIYPFLIIWNTLLYELDKRRKPTKPSFLRWHSAFWDERQRLPLQGLDQHVLLVMRRNPEEGKAALNYLNTSRQRWAAQEVQIELDVRELERCTDVAAIGNAYRNLALGGLNSPVSFLLTSFSRISEDVAAALNQNSAYNQRLALSAVAERLNGLIGELTRSGDKYAVRFRPIAYSWYEIVTDYVRELAEVVELRQEIDNPYIIGVPLTEQQEIFVKPVDLSGTYISTRIEQLLLDRRRPPLLLYGQRRMGKTSLLNNLGRLLPSNIIPMFVDLQGPVSSASDSAGFLYNIARSMADSAKRQSALTLPSLKRETLQDDPFTRFDEWLREVEKALQQNIALLALDEFEALDNAITKGRFDQEDVLGMLRHLIQHRPRFKVLLAGSHTIEEFQRWASYLINVQVVHISYLKQPEARQLIERPVHDFTLRYEPDAVERVLQLTRCHPFLIQLLCAEIIALKNEQDPSIRRLATLADVEAAIPEALSVGSFFFADIQSNQADAAGLAILQFLAAQGEGAIVSRLTILQHFPDKSDALNLLLQRELIEEVSEGYRFQVELIRRWFASPLSVQ
ncbi:AAA family ATPase [Microcoleus sp. LAD1_D3]|uniref:AAA family ATPase n=1 Tax=Microcoleus sp. LAD1_D3 TaxID=2819365 RepID=UPI002FD4E79D